jgi:nitrogen fixation NifU-like protein
VPGTSEKAVCPNAEDNLEKRFCCEILSESAWHLNTGLEDAMYSEKVLEHFRDPRNVGAIEDADGLGQAGGGPKCPEDLTYFWIRVSDGRIAEVKHKTLGCPVAIASSSITSALAEGKTLEEALRITPEAVLEALQEIPERKLDSNLGPRALRKAIENYVTVHGGQR